MFFKCLILFFKFKNDDIATAAAPSIRIFSLFSDLIICDAISLSDTRQEWSIYFLQNLWVIDPSSTPPRPSPV